MPAALRSRGRPRLSALRRRRTCRMHAAARLGGVLGEQASSRSCRRSRATAGRWRAICAGASMSCSSAERLCRRLLQAIRPDDRCNRPLRRDVQALPSDRTGIDDLDLRWRCAASRPDSRTGCAATSLRSPSASLRAGEMLDGEGGYTVWGKLMPAAASLEAGALPIGLAHRVKLKNDIAHGAVVRWSDVEIDAGNETVKTRRAMEARFGGAALPILTRRLACCIALSRLRCVKTSQPPLIPPPRLVILRAAGTSDFDRSQKLNVDDRRYKKRQSRSPPLVEASTSNRGGSA